MLKLSNLMPCPSAGSKQFWTSPHCFGQVQKDFQFGQGITLTWSKLKTYFGPTYAKRTGHKSLH